MYIVLRNLALALLATGMLTGCGESESTAGGDAATDKTYRWKMVTAWPPNLPVIMDEIHAFAATVETMSRGQLKIQVFAGGELVPPLQTFDAVSQGTVEMGHSAAYYWAGKAPAAQYMSAVPFGMTSRGMWSWLYGDDGVELWRKVYAPFDLVPIPMGNTGTQMGGWFNKRIESKEDLNGLKMRIPGLGGKVMDAAGANPVLLSGAEVYTALERGNIDATEWVGPLHDVRFGLDRAAKYYYYPGWQEPSTQLELLINKQAWESLPEHLQLIIENAAAATSVVMSAKMEVGNAAALAALRESGHIEVLPFPDDVLDVLHSASRVAMQKEADADPMVQEVMDNYDDFREDFDAWDAVTEAPFRRFMESRE